MDWALNIADINNTSKINYRSSVSFEILCVCLFRSMNNNLKLTLI